MDGVEHHFRPGGMRAPRHFGYIHDRADRVRSHRARHQQCARRKYGVQVFRMQPPVLTDTPPADPGALLLQRQPHGDVRFMIQVRDDDLGAVADGLSERQAYQAQERRGIHAEGDFVGSGGVEKHGDTLARRGDGGIDGLALGIAAAALHIVRDQVVGHGVQHGLRYLRAGGVIEKDESIAPAQGGEAIPNLVDGICEHFACPYATARSSNSPAPGSLVPGSRSQ